MSPARISIVTATYNRARVLERCLRAVRHQTRQDWELIVVGDACTDNTADVVASFQEPRFRWLGLPRNFGEQSGPNNEGAAVARAEWIAYLNHDDFWFPDHLALAAAHLERTGADLVFTRAASFEPDGALTLTGQSRDGLYDSTTIAPASTWLARRKMLEDLGGWRPARSLYNVPSQDLLFRAHRAGYALRQLPVLTTAIIPSGARQGSYLPSTGTGEHDAVLEALLRDPAAYRDELSRRVASTEASPVRVWLNRLCFAAGIHPMAVGHLLRHGVRGGRLNSLRRTRGLPAALPES